MTISGKHTIELIDGQRCVLIEKDASMDRAEFLRTVLEHNGYIVHLQKNIPPAPKVVKDVSQDDLPSTPTPPAPVVPDTFKVGVTDLSFVVSVMVYSRRLRTLENAVLLPSYWNQESVNFSGWYWKYAANQTS